MAGHESNPGQSPQGAPGSYYLSIVLCGRNDDYGRDYLKRLQTLVSGVDHFCAQHGLSCQLVFVEWNPPANRPPIKAVIKWGTHIGVKIVTVPGHIDARLPVNRGNSGLHEFIAKNTGIRRADGHFVLACTSDLVFSPELLQYLGRRELTADAVYRTTRINVRPLPDAMHPSEAPARCRQHVSNADLIGYRFHMPPELLERLFRSNVISVFGPDPKLRAIFDFKHDLEPLRFEAPLLRQFPHLIYVDAAGDFTLLSRDGWLKLGGYLENDCRNHVDAWFCFHAIKHDFAQVILPLHMCIYHQEHESSPLLPTWETLDTLSKLAQNPKWGLADENLGVEVIQVGVRDLEPQDDERRRSMSLVGPGLMAIRRRH
jgi:hypothetical protein